MYLCIFSIHSHSSLEVVGGWRGGGGVGVLAKLLVFERLGISLDLSKSNLKSFTFLAESKQSDLLRLSHKSASRASLFECKKG